MFTVKILMINNEDKDNGQNTHDDNSRKESLIMIIIGAMMIK